MSPASSNLLREIVGEQWVYLESGERVDPVGGDLQAAIDQILEWADRVLTSERQEDIFRSA